MHLESCRRLVPALTFLALLSAACAPSDTSDGGGPQAPWPATAGIQTSASLQDLVYGRGWTLCHEDTYDTTGPELATILAGCTGQYLALACRSGTADQLTLVAADQTSVVTQADAGTTTASHTANGVSWYFTDGSSWGFFPAGETVNRNPCDDVTSSQSDKRLCWQFTSDTLEMAPGYRCGSNVDLRASTLWHRLVLSHP